MDPQIVQNLRYKLQKRVRRLNSVDYQLFIPALKQFWAYFDNNQVFGGIMDYLVPHFPDLNETVEKIIQGEGLIGSTEDEAAAIGYAVLRRITDSENYSIFFSLARPYGASSKANEALETIRDVFLEPFYEYLDESLDDQRAMLALLFRYKHRCEWFHRERLWDITQEDSRHAEKSLALDLYEYLHNQGIDFNIEPSSITGEVDLIGAQGSDDPFLADTKIFDAKNRSKKYICKGFNQIYTYTQQYNEPFGYLIIYKTSDTDLRFSLSEKSRNIPVVTYNHKSIFLITIDIYSHEKSVSQREPLKVIEITEEELINNTNLQE